MEASESEVPADAREPAPAAAETVEEARAKREPTRLRRKVGMLGQQLEQFEDALSGHETNVLRLESLPEDLRGDDHEEALKAERRAITQLEHAITQTLAERLRLQQQLDEG